MYFERLMLCWSCRAWREQVYCPEILKPSSCFARQNCKRVLDSLYFCYTLICAMCHRSHGNGTELHQGRGRWVLGGSSSPGGGQALEQCPQESDRGTVLAGSGLSRDLSAHLSLPPGPGEGVIPAAAAIWCIDYISSNFPTWILVSGAHRWALMHSCNWKQFSWDQPITKQECGYSAVGLGGQAGLTVSLGKGGECRAGGVSETSASPWCSVGLTNAHCPVAEGQRCFGVQDLLSGGNSQGTLQDVPKQATVPQIHPMSIFKPATQFFHGTVSAGEKTPEAGDDKLSTLPWLWGRSTLCCSPCSEVRFPLMASTFLSVLFIFQFSASAVMLGYLSTECSVCSIESVSYANNRRAF